MAKIDTYLRSIERFGATGAVLVSGQSVTLRFPTGDRHATQVTSHELLVSLVREVAPPAALSALESERPVRFGLDGGGARYIISVTPGQREWQVAIESAAPTGPSVGESGGGGDDARARGAEGTSRPRAAGSAPERASEQVGALAIERTPYEAGEEPAATSGSALLDRLLAWARAHRATDLLVSAGAPALAKVDGEWVSAGEGQELAAEGLARELGVIAPASARAAWFERGQARFAVGDAAGRLRLCLSRDAAGPRAAVRFLRAEPPSVEQLGVPAPALEWLRAQRGLVLVAGAPGAGKTTTLAALVSELAQVLARAVVVIEDPIELVHRSSALVSQREVGAHVASAVAGIHGAMREGAQAIAVARSDEPGVVEAALTAVEAGHLVLLEVAAARSSGALAGLLGALASAPGGAARWREALVEGTRGVLAQALVPRRDRAGAVAAYEVVPGGADLGRVLAEQRLTALPELMQRSRGQGAVTLEEAAAVLRGAAVDPRL